MPDTLTLPAPAKLNLCLHITGRRPDGYHLLQTAFQLLDHGDTLHFARREDDAICLHPNLKGVSVQDNLIYRAAQLLQPHCQQGPPGIDITLDKRLPMGGGLGGGSSDAATTLLALNQLWQCQLTTTQLQTLGLSLGADVPVFIGGHSAWAEGVGEQLTALELPERWFVVLTPQCQVSTAEVFCHKDLTRDTAPITVAAFLEQGGKNDCQALVRKLHPEVDNALIWLDKFAGESRMSGTGASVFAAFDSERAAHDLLAKAPGDLSGFVARGVNRSTVVSAIADSKKSL